METIRTQLQNAFPFTVYKKPMLHMEKVESLLSHLIYMQAPVTPEAMEMIKDTASDERCFRLYRSDTGEAVGNPVSEGYVLHNLDNIITLTEAIQESLGCELKLRTHWNNGEFIIAEPTKEARLQCKADDALWKRVIVNGRYGGLSPLTGLAGLFRDTCTNLMMIESVQTAHMSIRHTANLPNRVDELLMKFNRLTDSWELSLDKINQMSRNTVNLGDYTDQVWQIERDPDKPNTRADNRARAIANRWNNEQPHRHPSVYPYHIETNAWSAYNAVQGHIQHNGEQTTHNIGRALHTLDSTRVKRAEQLALATT